MVPRGGIEPPTQGFSEYCSTKAFLNKGFARGLNLVCDRVCDKTPKKGVLSTLTKN